MKEAMEDQKKEESFESMLAEHEAKSEKLQPGQKVKGQIISIAGDDVFVDIGLKLDGIMDRKELLDVNGNFSANAGDQVEAFVIDVSSQGARLSKSMSGSGVAALEEAMHAAIPVTGKITETCKGGYHVNVLGKTAFCPGSQMEFSASGNNDEFVGTEKQFLIIRVENNGRNIVVSRRALLDKERNENLSKFADSVKAGDIVEAKITRIVPFGAFAELMPGIEGMIHISELSWSRADKPEEIVNVGDMVNVKVLNIGADDKGRQRISLSIKQAHDDPWSTVSANFKTDETVDGIVRRIAPFGAFIEIAPGIEGLAHISELSWDKRVHKVEDVLKPGEKVKVKIKEINPDAKKISLSVRDALGDPWADAPQQFAPDTIVEGIIESKGPHGYFITLAPGITGLLPQSNIKNSAKNQEILKLGAGDAIKLKVQTLDSAARRISLIPVEPDNLKPEEDKSWREHTKSAPANQNLGILGQALQAAFQKKKQG